jgi:hypothetical protein
MRWVGAGSTALSAIAVYLVSKGERIGTHTKPASNRRDADDADNSASTHLAN